MDDNILSDSQPITGDDEEVITPASPSPTDEDEMEEDVPVAAAHSDSTEDDDWDDEEEGETEHHDLGPGMHVEDSGPEEL